MAITIPVRWGQYYPSVFAVNKLDDTISTNDIRLWLAKLPIKGKYKEDKEGYTFLIFPQLEDSIIAAIDNKSTCKGRLQLVYIPADNWEDADDLNYNSEYNVLGDGVVYAITHPNDTATVDITHTDNLPDNDGIRMA